MRDKWLKIPGMVSVAAGAFFASGWSFFQMAVCCKGQKTQKKRKWFELTHTKINHPRHKFEKEYEEGKAWCISQKMQDCYIKSRDGLKLHAYYLPAENARRFVILCHGYKGSGFGDFAYTARFLHENRCSLLFIDQRCCGKSEGEYITFGALEQYDVQRWAYYTAKQDKKKLPIYLYGESMGASSVLMASGHKLPKEVRGLVADCGFRSMRSQIKDMAANWFHIHWIGLLLFRLNLFCGLFAGFRMEDADTTQALQKNKRPVLFFHGEGDTYVNPKNSRYNYSVCRASKELVVVPEARHLCSAYAAPELYRKKLLEFFSKCER